MAEAKLFKIKELAQWAQVSTRTIDYYTTLGLISECRRSPGNHRLYALESLQTIKIIKVLQEHRYSLEEIAAILSGRKKSNLYEQIMRIQEHLDELQQEVAQLSPAIQEEAKENPQLKLLANELAVKGSALMKALLILLGEPTI